MLNNLGANVLGKLSVISSASDKAQTEGAGVCEYNIVIKIGK